MSTEEEQATTTTTQPATSEADEKIVEGDANEEGVTDENNNNEEGKKNGQRFNNKRDETPIEELYDLTKPIPKVERPDKAEHEKELEEMTAVINALSEERRAVQDQINASKNDADGRSSLQQARAELKQLKAQKTALIDSKKALRSQLDQMKDQTDKIMKDKKDARSNIKYSSIEEIEGEIKKLQRKQETTSMTLTEEKKLIKEMDALQASKKFVADLKNKDAAMADVKEQRKSITEQIAAKDKEIDGFTKKIDEVMNTLNELNGKEDKKRDEISDLIKKRDEIKEKVDVKIKERNDLRAAFREKNNEWFNYQRAVRAQKKMQYEEEKKKREEERQAYLALLEAEEAKKIPYEEEQALCDFLANFLERTYLDKDDKAGKDDKSNEVVEVKDDPFAGLTPVNKKSDEEYFGKGKGKKKRVRQAKKQDSTTGPFRLSVDMFEQFGLLNLTPPTSIDQVEGSIKELRDKKEWYKQQPRGSVPTAAEIRKANEKRAAQLRQEQNGGAASSGTADATAGTPSNGNNKSKATRGGFNLSSDEFVPLASAAGASASTSTTTGINSSWGQGGKSSLLQQQQQPTSSANDPLPSESVGATTTA